MTPTKIKLHKQDGHLELTFPATESSHATRFELSAEFLRVHSPSAEVKGHGPDQAVLQFGKKNVKVLNIERAGNYALRMAFDDGHDSGIYTWDYLYNLGENHENLWRQYLGKLHAAGKHREKDIQVVQLMDPPNQQ